MWNLCEAPWQRYEVSIEIDDTPGSAQGEQSLFLLVFSHRID